MPSLAASRTQPKRGACSSRLVRQLRAIHCVFAPAEYAQKEMVYPHRPVEEYVVYANQGNRRPAPNRDEFGAQSQTSTARHKGSAVRWDSRSKLKPVETGYRTPRVRDECRCCARVRSHLRERQAGERR